MYSTFLNGVKCDDSKNINHIKSFIINYVRMYNSTPHYTDKMTINNFIVIKNYDTKKAININL
jgi:hypothetical protein